MHDPRTPPTIFDRPLLDQRRLRAARQTGGIDFLAARAADDLVDRLGLINRFFDRAVEIGSFGSPLKSALAERARTSNVGDYWTLDTISDQAMAHGTPSILADPERLPFAPGSLDLVLSSLHLQWTNDLPGVLTQIRNALKPDGLFLAALVGGETLAELRDVLAIAEMETLGGVSPRVAPMIDVRAMGGLLQRAGFALPVVDYDRVAVTYETPFHLFKDLRGMGATNCLVERHKSPLPRQTLFHAIALYRDKYGLAGGRISAQFDILYAAGWCPHASQQQPLRPGSAKHRLADALGTDEKKLSR